MGLAQQLTDYIHAAFSGVYIVTSEPDEAEREIVQLNQQVQQVGDQDVAELGEEAIETMRKHQDRAEDLLQEMSQQQQGGQQQEQGGQQQGGY